MALSTPNEATGEAPALARSDLERLGAAEVRRLIREGRWTQTTKRLALGREQANLVILEERYAFDFDICSRAKGYAQVDTGQDAWYFGTWAHPTRLIIVTYMEGDIRIQHADTPDEFVAEIRKIHDWNEKHGHGFKGIDPLMDKGIKDAFIELGLADLLH